MREPPPRKPIQDAAVWRGRELLDRADWERRLTPEHLQELVAAARATRDRPLGKIDPRDFPLPTVAPLLNDVQHQLEHGSGLTRLTGLDVSSFDEASLERVFWGLARHVGTPVSQNAKGECLLHVRDERFPDGDPRARGPNTRRALSFHTDRCDVIAFLCVTPARAGGENEVLSSATLYNDMLRQHPEHLKVLCEPYPYLRHTVDTGNELPYCEQPIFSMYEDHFAANLLRVLIDRADRDPAAPNLTDAQREALDVLESVANQPALSHRFRQAPGDLLFLNNWVTMHRRGAFDDHEDFQQRRHLLRLWLSVPNSRPLDPRFAAHYGTTAAGALRGGMRPRLYSPKRSP